MEPSHATIQLIQAARTNNEIKQLLLALFTPQELKQLEQRIQILRLLKSGVPQREIADRLHVGIATVTRGARVLQEGGARNV